MTSKVRQVHPVCLFSGNDWFGNCRKISSEMRAEKPSQLASSCSGSSRRCVSGGILDASYGVGAHESFLSELHCLELLSD